MKIYEKPIYGRWRKYFTFFPVLTIDDEIICLEIVERRMVSTRIPNVSPSSWIQYRRVSKLKGSK